MMNKFAPRSSETNKAERIPPSNTSRVVSILIAAPAILVPAIVMIVIYWARETFFELRPATAFGTGSSTISRAISEPAVAGPFAVTITFAAALLALATWRIIGLHLIAINAVFKNDHRRRRIGIFFLGITAVAEASGIAGMVLLSWIAERFFHIGGSYMFFAGQATAILFSGLVCGMIFGVTAPAHTSEPGGLTSWLNKWRARTAPGIAAATAVFWIFFLFRGGYSNISKLVNWSFSALEILVILSFLLYLATFSYDLYRAQMHR